MQMESHATPTAESPQLRYASLHRAIDRGLDADEIWSELAEVCLQIGQGDEAVRCAKRIRRDALRLALESKLTRAGLLTAAAVAPVPTDGAPGQDPVSAGSGPRPAAAERVPRGAAVADTTAADQAPATTLEWLGDALGYLCQRHLPWLVLGVAAAFPVLAGFGGAVTVGSSPGWVAVLVACPAVVGLVLAAATLRRIVVASGAGESEPPPVGDPGRLLADAWRASVDLGLVGGLLLGPCLFALHAGAPLVSALPGLLVGGFFLPLAIGLRTVRGDLAALSPVRLLRGLQRTGTAYAGLLLVLLVVFAPAALGAFVVAHRPIWMQLMVLGPLLTVQVFFAARLLGTWLDAMRLELGAVLCARPGVAPSADPVRAAVPPVRAAAPGPATSQPQRPAALAHYATPPAQARPKRRAPAAPAAGRAKAAAAAAPAPAAVPEVAEERTIEGRAPRGKLADAPDLRHMPGATVVSGAERTRAGAAARR